MTIKRKRDILYIYYVIAFGSQEAIFFSPFYYYYFSFDPGKHRREFFIFFFFLIESKGFPWKIIMDQISQESAIRDKIINKIGKTFSDSSVFFLSVGTGHPSYFLFIRFVIFFSNSVAETFIFR